MRWAAAPIPGMSDYYVKSITAIGTRLMAQGAFLKDEPWPPASPFRGLVHTIPGDLTTVAWEREFDLAVMTGHAFQQLVEDDLIRASLASIHAALAVDGVVAFETRNPLARKWEHWTPEHGVDFAGADGEAVRLEKEVETPVSGDVVRFTTTYTSAGWDQQELSHGTLRFLDRDKLSAFLHDAGFVIEDQFGDWDRSRVLDASPEIITLARRT